MNTANHKHGAFLLRVALGTVLLEHGLLKVVVFTVPGTVGFFESIGLPASVAYLTIFAELVGGDMCDPNAGEDDIELKQRKGRKVRVCIVLSYDLVCSI